MTHPENNSTLWSESRVESLLEDFFQQEMPPTLRRDAPAMPARGQQAGTVLTTSNAFAAPKGRARSSAGLMTLGIVGLLMGMMAFVFWPDRSNDSTNHASNSKSPAGLPTDSKIGERSETDIADVLKQNADGPVEMRQPLPHVGIGDPEPMLPTDANPPFPELDVEVYPLDRTPAEAEKPSARKNSLPESKANRAPMPEEHRQLPESQPPRQTDPDEAALEAILPELQTY